MSWESTGLITTLAFILRACSCGLVPAAGCNYLDAISLEAAPGQAPLPSTVVHGAITQSLAEWCAPSAGLRGVDPRSAAAVASGLQSHGLNIITSH